MDITGSLKFCKIQTMMNMKSMSNGLKGMQRIIIPINLMSSIPIRFVSIIQSRGGNMHFPKIEKDKPITYRFRGKARDVRPEIGQIWGRATITDYKYRE
jgi:hypothetical protein